MGAKAFPAKVRSGFASGQCVNIRLNLVNSIGALIIVVENVQNFAERIDENVGQRINFLTQNQSGQIGVVGVCVEVKIV